VIGSQTLVSATSGCVRVLLNPSSFGVLLVEVVFILTITSVLMSSAVALGFFHNAWRVGKFAPSEAPLDCSHVLISVIIPARNEEQDLEKSLASVLQQEGVRLEVIVVNDHSDDRTGEVADAVASQDDRVRVIHNPPLKPGWLGKCNAMEHARLLAKGDYILLTDADIMHHQRSFASAVAHMQNRGLDFFSICPTIECVSFWENVFIPSGIAAASLLFWKPADQSGQKDQVGATGALMLSKREMLESIGGLDSIKGEMLDDVSLAWRIHESGGRVDFRVAPQMAQVRMFKDNRHAFWGITKNILAGFDSVWMAIPGILLPFVVFWSPLIGLACGIFQDRGDLIGLGFLGIALQLVLLAGVRRFCKFSWRKAVFYPMCAIQCACCLSVAIYHRLCHRAVLWRGRAVTVSPSPTKPADFHQS
jgi:chlorobactene glucosyltransferase